MHVLIDFSLYQLLTKGHVIFVCGKFNGCNRVGQTRSSPSEENHRTLIATGVRALGFDQNPSMEHPNSMLMLHYILFIGRLIAWVSR